MTKTISNEKFIIVESNKNLIRILKKDETISTRKNGKISFESVLGKKFDVWYSQENNHFLENELEINLKNEEIKKNKCELSIKKEKN